MVIRNIASLHSCHLSMESAATTPEDIKMTETIMAYIERIFDGSQFRARVDSEFKINYDTIRGGMYGPNNKTYPNANGAVGRYNEAIKDNYVSFFMPLSDMAWGCNGSGFSGH